MKTTVIVPAKTLSERLPNKNAMRVGGRTLVERAVYCGQDADVVVIATDDAEHERAGLAMAESIGVRGAVLRLTPELTAKRAHLEDVISEVVARWPADRYVLLQPTSPLRQRRHVKSALAILEKSGCDSVVSVHEVTKDVYFAGDLDERTGRFCPWRLCRGRHLYAAAESFFTGTAAAYAPSDDNKNRRFTNDLSKLVAENGAVYAWTHDHWRRTGSRMGGDMRAMEMDVSDSVDIDTPAELERAQRRFE